MRQAVYGNVNHPAIATSYGHIGLVNMHLGHYIAALDSLMKCLAINAARNNVEDRAIWTQEDSAHRAVCDPD